MAKFLRVGCGNASLRLSRGNDTGRALCLRLGHAKRPGYELLEKALGGL